MFLFVLSFKVNVKLSKIRENVCTKSFGIKKGASVEMSVKIPENMETVSIGFEEYLSCGTYSVCSNSKMITNFTREHTKETFFNDVSFYNIFILSACNNITQDISVNMLIKNGNSYLDTRDMWTLYTMIPILVLSALNIFALFMYNKYDITFLARLGLMAQPITVLLLSIIIIIVLVLGIYGYCNVTENTYLIINGVMFALYNFSYIGIIYGFGYMKYFTGIIRKSILYCYPILETAMFFVLYYSSKVHLIIFSIINYMLTVGFVLYINHAHFWFCLTEDDEKDINNIIGSAGIITLIESFVKLYFYYLDVSYQLIFVFLYLAIILMTLILYFFLYCKKQLEVPASESLLKSCNTSEYTAN